MPRALGRVSGLRKLLGLILRLLDTKKKLLAFKCAFSATALSDLVSSTGPTFSPAECFLLGESGVGGFKYLSAESDPVTVEIDFAALTSIRRMFLRA